MRHQALLGLSVLSLFIVNDVSANWVCNISNQNEHQWTVVADDESTVEAMALRVCTAHQITKKNCNPDCYENGMKSGRWHCAIINPQGQHWSYFAPTQKEAESLAQHGCSLASMTTLPCKPTCIPE